MQNEPSQMALEWTNQDVCDVTTSQQGSCVTLDDVLLNEYSKHFDQLVIQLAVRVSALYSWLHNCLCKVYTDLKVLCLLGIFSA